MLVTFSFEPSAQCKAAQNTEHPVLLLIRRSFVELSPKAFVCLYCSLVSSHQEYIFPVCSSYLHWDIKHLERIHTPATRMVTKLKGLRYEKRFQKFSQPQVEVRWHQTDLAAFKIFTGKLALPTSLVFDQPSRSGFCRHIFKVSLHDSSPNGVVSQVIFLRQAWFRYS